MRRRIRVFLLMLTVTSFPIISGFGACSGPSGGTGGGTVTFPAPPVCPPTGTNPPGGFCVAFYDQNGAGVKVPHIQVSIQGSATGQPVNGLTPTGSVTSFSFNGRNVSFGWPQYCTGCEINEFWNGTYNLANDIPCTSGVTQWGMGITANNTTWPIFTCMLLTGTSTFSLVNSLPPTLTMQASGFTTTGGMPQLTTYGPDLSLISTTSASSVSPDGTVATFNFPKYANGTTLTTGHYASLVSNQPSSGVFSNIALSTLSIGSNDTSQTTPYGVDAVNLSISGQTCQNYDYTIYCTPIGPDTYLSPILTLSSTGQVSATNGSIVVGSQPTAIKAYGNYNSIVWLDTYGGYQVTGQPANAIVTNFASDTVSILDLISNVVAKTISVGTKPVTVVLNSNQTKAYVANYGSSSTSEIDLGTSAQSRVAPVGSSPAALAMDPSGSAVWVGGLNYISKVDLASFSVVQTFSVSGQVTSLAVSAGQNSLVYTTVATAGGSTTFQAQQASLATGSFQAAYATYTTSSSSYYAQAITSGGPAPGAPGWLMSSGALVSAPYGNRYAVLGTPTGFVVIDLQTKTQMLAGSTPSAVRGIATDPGQGVIYLTAPDSNSLITVPYPPQPQ